MEDKEIVCRECGAAFVWTAGEQEFFEKKGLTNIPSRCPICRKKRDVKHSFANEFDVVCKICGKKAKSPFKPENAEDVICHECFMKESESKSGSDDIGDKTDSDNSDQTDNSDDTQNEPVPPPAFEKQDGPPNHQQGF